MCNVNEETLTHLFWERVFVQQFLKDLERLIRTKCYNCARFSFKLELVIFGHSNNVITDKAMDLIILLAKFYIYKCRFLDDTPNCLSFVLQLKNRIEIERLIAIRRNKYKQFQLLWFPYSNLLETENRE